MAGGGKKKAQKLTWQELQAQFGDVSRNPIDNLPTSSRSHADNPRDSYRSSMFADRERRERREDRDEAPSRADESSAWRSSKPVSNSSFRDDRSGRSDDGMWRMSRASSTSSFGGGGFSRRSDDLPMREPDSSGRPRLNLVKPSAERLAAAQEQQLAAKQAITEEKPTTKSSNPFGDARPVSKANPFGDAKPVAAADKTATTAKTSTTAEPWRPRSARQAESDSRFARPSNSDSRFSRPSDSESRFSRPSADSESRFARPAETDSRFSRPSEPDSRLPAKVSDRFSRPIETPTARPKDTPVVNITPSLPPKKVAVPERAPSPAVSDRSRSPVRSVHDDEPESTGPIRSALQISMTEGSWVTADELADCIGQVSLETDESIDELGHVIALSLAQKTVLLPSALSLIPKDKLPAVLRNALCRLVKKHSSEDLENIIGNVDIVQALGFDSSLKREEIAARLKEIGLEQLTPKEDVAVVFRALCDQSASEEVLLNELRSRFPRKNKVPVDVAFVIGEYVTRMSLRSGSFDQSVLEQYQQVLAFVAATVMSQTYMLFGVQEAWFAHGSKIKRSGKAIFESLFEMRLITIDAMVSWMHDKERTTGKRSLLLQCGGYISDLQNSAIARQFEDADSDDSVDLDSDFPQANRNYDDY